MKRFHELGIKAKLEEKAESKFYLKHGLWRFCGLKDCVYFEKRCGLAALKHVEDSAKEAGKPVGIDNIRVCYKPK